MTHRRKHYHVYPPNYNSDVGNYKTYRSKRQAFKNANKEGCWIMESVFIYQGPRRMWASVGGVGREWEIVKRK